MRPLQLSDYRKIVVLTGAGVSVASGLRPYRGEGGIWGEIDSRAVATAEGFAEDPEQAWAHWWPFRATVAKARPNEAHRALAQAEARLAPGTELIVITQNVDGLHQRAGSRQVIELHGRLDRTRCGGCDREPFEDRTWASGVPVCEHCSAPLRPDVVFFGEPIPALADHQAKRAFRGVDLFLAVGTSGMVDPAARFVRWARYEGARTVLVNREPLTEAPAGAEADFDEIHLGRAEELLPRLLA